MVDDVECGAVGVSRVAILEDINVHVIDSADQLLFEGGIDIPVQGEGVVVQLVLVRDGSNLGLGRTGWDVGSDARVCWWSIPRCAGEGLVLVGTNGESKVAVKSGAEGARNGGSVGIEELQNLLYVFIGGETSDGGNCGVFEGLKDGVDGW